IDAPIHGKEVAHPALARGREPSASRRIADQHGDLLCERHRIIGRCEQPCHPVLDQLGYPRHVGRKASQPLALSFHQDVWQAIAVAVSCRLCSKHKEIGRAITDQYIGLSQGTSPFYPAREAEPLSLTTQ